MQRSENVAPTKFKFSSKIAWAAILLAIPSTAFAQDESVLLNPPKQESGVSSAFRKAGDSISGMFKGGPRETQIEDDPIRLDNMPGEVGANVYLSAARMLENGGNFDGAERQYRSCLEKYPSNRLALISYGRLLHRKQALDQAEAIYQVAIEKLPDDATVHNDYGLCLIRLGRPGEAMAKLHRATVLDPENPRYRNNLAMLLVQEGRIDEAHSQMIYAHGEAAGNFNLGFLLFKQGDIQSAAKGFQAALAADPNMEPAKVMLQKISGNPPQSAPNRVPPAPRTARVGDQPRGYRGQPAYQGKHPPSPRLLPPVR